MSRLQQQKLKRATHAIQAGAQREMAAITLGDLDKRRGEKVIRPSSDDVFVLTTDGAGVAVPGTVKIASLADPLSPPGVVNTAIVHGTRGVHQDPISQVAKVAMNRSNAHRCSVSTERKTPRRQAPLTAKEEAQEIAGAIVERYARHSRKL